MTQHHTISYLRNLFREVGIQPATRHGQNFLIDINLQNLIVESAQIGPADVVLEVGTGTGALTAQIARLAGAVVTVEIDKHLHQLASEELMDASNVTMLQHDVLKNKNRFDPRVLEAVREQLEARPSGRFKLVANLPYNIATPVLSNLLSCDVVPATMTATIQKELADRITAKPWTKDYSALSLWVQSQCHVQIVRTLPPTVFWPQPKVTSAILHIEVDEALRGQIPDLKYWHDFLKAMFLHRRKFVRSVLLAAYKKRLSKPEADEVMEALGFGPTTRAEQLDVDSMLAFCEALRQRVPDWSLS